MKKSVLLFILILCPILLKAYVFAEKSTMPYKIVSVKAYLYYEQTNTFSKDIFSKPDVSLWNTIIGEGFAESPSNSTMVVVEISGSPESYEPNRKIEFIAYDENKKVILKRTAPTGILSKSGQYFQAFWLYDTGCSEIKIVAQIIGQSQISKIEKTIPFTCGE